jgi:hypothetical protein
VCSLSCQLAGDGGEVGEFGLPAFRRDIALDQSYHGHEQRAHLNKGDGAADVDPVPTPVTLGRVAFELPGGSGPVFGLRARGGID